MTATSSSLMFSGCFVTLLVWGYHSTEMMVTNATYGESTLSFACGNNSHRCQKYCSFCYNNYGAPTMDCLSFMLDHLCLLKFDGAMASLNNTDWCTWGNVSVLYSDLSLCTEEISDCLVIPWPNQLVEQTFVDIHSRFFKDCPTEQLSDPPPVIVFALVITPICLIPVMVSLVVLKTKNADGSS